MIPIFIDSEFRFVDLTLATLVTRPGFSLYPTTPRQVLDRPFHGVTLATRHVCADIDEWTLLSLHRHDTDEVRVYLTGQVRGTSKFRVTSSVREIDLVSNRVITQNSLYALGSKGDGEPSSRQLLTIVYVFGAWGIADSLGMPQILLGGCE